MNMKLIPAVALAIFLLGAPCAAQTNDQRDPAHATRNADQEVVWQLPVIGAETWNRGERWSCSAV